MTYVVGLEFEGMNSILADTRGTWLGPGLPKGENVFLKTGLLFPGCIFGRVGNLNNSRKFILSAKYSLTPINTIQEFWSEFVDYASKYRFPNGKDDHFQILLSTRYSGNPKFYLLDSSDGMKELLDRPITLGSGKSILDNILVRDYQNRVAQMEGLLTDQPFRQEVYPYLFCLWLNELTQTFEQQVLETHRVGGPFHFVFQIATSEHYQKPSMYVYCDLNVQKRIIYFWQYRLAYVKNWLIVDKLIPPHQLREIPNGKQERIALLDDSSLPPKETGSWDRNLLYQELVNSVEDELAKQPLYFFCGFGYTDPKYRTGFVFTVTTEDDYVLSDQGIREDIRQMIIANISDVAD